MKKLFIAPVIVSLLALALVYWWGGMTAFLLAAALAVLEVTLSFDNAIVNAKVLAQMPPHWQKRFLTWGMLISVVGVRLLLPIVIVSMVTMVSPFIITALAFGDPIWYAALVAGAQPAIEAFGGAFLLLTALRYFFDVEKVTHWFGAAERRLARWGRIEAIGVALTLTALLFTASWAAAPTVLILKSGLIGVILFILVNGLTSAIGMAETATAAHGLALFVYINVLDAAFSLDGVVGAFALTRLVPIIVVGLGIGAYFVRALTLVLVRGGTLKKLRYLEHGAHWAIFALAVCMFASLVVSIPEWFVATIGLALIALAYVSSQSAVPRAEKR